MKESSTVAPACNSSTREDEVEDQKIKGRLELYARLYLNKEKKKAFQEIVQCGVLRISAYLQASLLI